ncbi:hypothetical protein HanIR_Chr07g0313201 [Helianthus annuus]|nr:hypothetical protein HanIR_Chr07g0313201 [Helianthus annuus]
MSCLSLSLFVLKSSDLLSLHTTQKLKPPSTDIHSDHRLLRHRHRRSHFDHHLHHFALSVSSTTTTPTPKSKLCSPKSKRLSPPPPSPEITPINRDTLRPPPPSLRTLCLIDVLGVSTFWGFDDDTKTFFGGGGD